MSDSSPVPSHAADHLMAAIEEKRSPVCVGIDPVIDNLPVHLPRHANRPLSDAAMRISDYCVQLLAALEGIVPAVKIQSACFERLGEVGFVLPAFLSRIAHAQNLEVILDAKRGDIGLTAEHYAHAAFVDRALDATDDSAGLAKHSGAADWLTINSYLGEDGITPFLRPSHGAFALVRTSNPEGDEVQNLELKRGGTVSHAVAEMIARIGSKHVGQRGYSSLGAVVGATKPQDAKRLREIMPQQMFLVPGYGAQGGGIEDVLPCFKSDGTGAIVTASRSVIYAFKKDDPKWAESVADAAAKFADDVGKAVGMRK